jgi:uncharacterized ubiquitin-like protein YukD
MLKRYQKINEVITIAKGNQKLTLHREDKEIVRVDTIDAIFGKATSISMQDILDLADVLNLAVAEFKKYPAVEAAHE